MIAYPVGRSGQNLVLSHKVLSHFSRWRQLRWYQREAGGQLFARIGSGQILVEEATGPRWTDRRTRHTYMPDRRAEQREILRRHRQGLHFVGDWHTHAERVPVPSPLDLESMTDAFRRSTHALNAFVLIIVGQADPPEGLHVLVCDASGGYKLRPSGERPYELQSATPSKPVRRIL